MSDRYQVVAECAYVKTSDSAGTSWRLYEKGALINGDTPNLQHLLTNNYVVKVGGEATGGVDAAGVPSGAYEVEVPSGITTTPVEVDGEKKAADAAAKAAAEVDEKRAAARAKLPTDGSAPKSSHGQDVWVEYLVANGSAYDDVAKADKAELMKLAQSRQS